MIDREILWSILRIGVTFLWLFFIIKKEKNKTGTYRWTKASLNENGLGAITMSIGIIDVFFVQFTRSSFYAIFFFFGLVVFCWGFYNDVKLFSRFNRTREVILRVLNSKKNENNVIEKIHVALEQTGNKIPVSDLEELLEDYQIMFSKRKNRYR